ncbi:pilus assembly protein TadG-related protein [Zobellella sp. An-6]|uniref:pilus assembly protein TadG-related protein n=1 Tax=Zobellella sp. An-6 TaxID=3400218 RepID=UPI00404349F2
MVRQRGAVVFTFLWLFTALLLVTALAIDAGRLYTEQRRLQKQADLAALTLGRHACYIDGAGQAAELEAEVRANLAANGFATDGVNMRLQFGRSHIADSRWQIDTGGAPGSAGRVELSRRVPASLLAGGLMGQEITLAASAGIDKQMVVGYSLGSGLASLDEGLLNALLGGLLGAELDLDLLHYQGLARSRVHLGRLLQLLGEENATELTLGSTRTLLETQVPLGTLLQLMLEAVDQEQAAGLDLGVIEQRLTAAAQVEDAMVSLDELLFLQTPGDEDQQQLSRAALQSQLNALELIKGAIMVSNLNNAVDLGLGTGDFPLISDLADLSVKASVIEPPRYRLGRLPEDAGELYMETAQLRLELGVNILKEPLALSILGLAGVEVAPFWLDLGITAGSARSHLTHVTGCALQEDLEVGLEVTPSIASMSLNTVSPLKLSAIVLLASVPLADVSLGPINVAAEPNNPELVSINPQQLPSEETQVSASSGESLGNLLSSLLLQLDGSTIHVNPWVGGLVDSLLAQLITPIVAPLLESVSAQVVDPMLDTLGLSLGNAYLRVDSVAVIGGDLIE